MTTRMLGMLAAITFAGCALDEESPSDDQTPETSSIESSLVNGCTANVAAPYSIGSDVYASALVQNCAYTTSVHTLIRIDIPIFADKTVAENYDSATPGSDLPIYFSGRCNWSGWKTIFVEARLTNGSSTSKKQSPRAELHCP